MVAWYGLLIWKVIPVQCLLLYIPRFWHHQYLSQRRLNYASGLIAQECFGDDYNDITYNQTYLYDIKIGLDFHFFL